MIALNDLDKVIFNGSEMDKVIYNGITVWEKASDEPVASVSLTLKQIHDFAPKETSKIIKFSRTAPEGDGWTIEDIGGVKGYKKELGETYTSGSTTYSLIEAWFVSKGDIEITDCGSLFAMYEKMASIDLDNFYTDNVQYYSDMFFDCVSLTTLDLSKFVTTKATSFCGLLWQCTNLASLNISGFDFSNVEDISYMFCGCSSLTSLDVSGWNTSRAYYMNNIFQNCSSLTTIDVSNWDTSCNFDFSYMFCNCSQVTELNVENFNTMNAENMKYMFSGCSSITSINVAGFNTQYVTDTSYMFSECTNLQSLDFNGSWNTEQVTDMSYMFYRDNSLQYLWMDYFNTANVVNMDWMFLGTNLNELHLGSGFSMESANTWASIFELCYNRIDIYVNSQTPPVLKENIFAACNVKAVYIPEGTMGDYITTDYWNELNSYFQEYSF